MKTLKNGVACLVLDDDKKPYTIHMADAKICHKCGTIVYVANPQPAFESHLDSFEDVVRKFRDSSLLIEPAK